MLCQLHQLGERFSFNRDRFEAFARDNFGCGGGIDAYICRHRHCRRGTAPEFAMVVAEAHLADAISAPDDLTLRVRAVRHDEAVVFVAGVVGRGQSPQLASCPTYVHETRFASFQELARTVEESVRSANTLLPYHRRLLAAQRAVEHTRCSPVRRRRGCSL
jgi:hypothetical protein